MEKKIFNRETYVKTINALKIEVAILIVFVFLYLAHIVSASLMHDSSKQANSAMTSKTSSVQRLRSGSTTQQRFAISTVKTSSKQQSAFISTQNKAESEKKSTSQQSNNCMPTDASITSTIKLYIATNEAVSLSKIDVMALNKIVNLIGSVSSTKEAMILIKIAESAENVKDVDISKLVINGNQKLPEDFVITSKVEGMFIREKLFANKDSIKPIEVKTIKGVVFLKGIVSNQAQVAKAVKLTMAIKGVNKINSQIIIEENNKK